MNVGTVAGKWNKIWKLINDNQIDVLCMQDARVKKEACVATVAKARNDGGKVFVGEATNNAARQPI